MVARWLNFLGLERFTHLLEQDPQEWVRYRYSDAALFSMCDLSLGPLLATWIHTGPGARCNGLILLSFAAFLLPCVSQCFALTIIYAMRCTGHLPYRRQPRMQVGKFIWQHGVGAEEVPLLKVSTRSWLGSGNAGTIACRALLGCATVPRYHHGPRGDWLRGDICFFKLLGLHGDLLRANVPFIQTS
jgi:hypothetical protein